MSYDDDEDDVYYISDQDSDDEKPQIQSIIHHTTKKFKNESYAVKILLSDHYREFRANFFENVRRTNKSVFQAIKREIRNTLNPYRRFIKERIEISEDIQKLYNSFKAYYKERNFNNIFFINYFRDLENSHQGKAKFDMLPKDEVETLNDIQRKVTIIKNLRHYLNTSIRDRIQMNYEQKKELFENDYFDMMYRYLVIDEDVFSKMDDKKVFEYLSNQKNSPKLRRPLNDFNVYNYVPILCKGYCQKEAKMFVDKFNKVITTHYSETNCSSPFMFFFKYLFHKFIQSEVNDNEPLPPKRKLLGPTGPSPEYVFRPCLKKVKPIDSRTLHQLGEGIYPTPPEIIGFKKRYYEFQKIEDYHLKKQEEHNKLLNENLIMNKNNNASNNNKTGFTKEFYENISNNKLLGITFNKELYYNYKNSNKRKKEINEFIKTNSNERKHMEVKRALNLKNERENFQKDVNYVTSL